MGVGEAAATALALVVHELDTNSVLSSEAGTLDLATRTEAKPFSLIWTERGGPQVEAPPKAEGFGSKLVRRSVAQQLGGAIHHNWEEDGLIVTIQLDRTKLSR